MNHFNSSYTYKYLEHIPYRFKYAYHKLAKTLHCNTFDFKHSCQNWRSLRKSKFYKIIVKHGLESFFIIVCKHYYFYKFGPKLQGICTRRMTKFKKEYTATKPRKRCCDSLILLSKEQWFLPPHKKWDYKK
jgi:hypothetical protein